MRCSPRFSTRQKALDIVQDDVNAVGGEDSVADTAVLLDADVQDASARHKLAVDREGLALCEGTGHERNADLVGGGVVGARPDDVVDVELVGSDAGHPGLAIGGLVITAGEITAA